MPTEPDDRSLWKKARSFMGKLGGKGAESRSPSSNEIVVPCCDPNSTVHIAYRAVSDDRLYMAKDRTWQEVRFFKPNGLRVFCAKCRHRLL